MTLEHAVKTLLIKEPFYGLFLLGINRVFDDLCKTACVCRNGINVELHINEEFWNSLDDETQLAIIQHELKSGLLIQ